MDDKTRTELEAAVFRRLVEHLRGRTDVQNIDLMNLAGFCRNCLNAAASSSVRVLSSSAMVASFPLYRRGPPILLGYLEPEG